MVLEFVHTNVVISQKIPAKKKSLIVENKIIEINLVQKCKTHENMCIHETNTWKRTTCK